MLSTTAEMMNSDHNWNRHQNAQHCYYYHRRNRGSLYINGDHDQLINLDLDHHGNRNPRTSPNNPIHDDHDDEQALKIDRNKRQAEENQDQTQVTSPSPSSSPSCSPSSSSSSRVCIDCKASKTPLWRTGPAGPKTLCNACGIRFRKRRKMDVDFMKVDEKEKVLVVPQRINGFQEEVAEAALLLMAISSGVGGGLCAG